MKNHYKFVRKSYAMQRMAAAIERAIQASSSIDKERAARWAAAWGLLCGIMTSSVKLRRSDVDMHDTPPQRRSSDQIEIPQRAPASSSATRHTSPSDSQPSQQQSACGDASAPQQSTN